MIFNQQASAPAPRILVVDDEPTLRLAFSMALSMEGYQVNCAENGSAAVEAIAAGTYQLVVLDLRMPGMDGLEVLQNVNAREDIEMPPTIMASAQISEAIAVRAMKQGVVDFLPKPITPLILREMVDRVMSEERSYAERMSNGTDLEDLILVKSLLRRRHLERAKTAAVNISSRNEEDAPKADTWRRVVSLISDPSVETERVAQNFSFTELT